MYNIEYDFGFGVGGILKINIVWLEKYSIMYNDIVGYCMYICNNWNFFLLFCKLRSIIGVGMINFIIY